MFLLKELMELCLAMTTRAWEKGQMVASKRTYTLLWLKGFGRRTWWLLLNGPIPFHDFKVLDKGSPFGFKRPLLKQKNLFYEKYEGLSQLYVYTVQYTLNTFYFMGINGHVSFTRTWKEMNNCTTCIMYSTGNECKVREDVLVICRIKVKVNWKLMLYNSTYCLE